jgi:uracil DNA glycosylase
VLSTAQTLLVLTFSTAPSFIFVIWGIEFNKAVFQLKISLLYPFLQPLTNQASYFSCKLFLSNNGSLETAYNSNYSHIPKLLG